MSKKAVINKLDNLLKPLGFTRQKAVWNRSLGHLVEVIDLQISKAGDIATLNVGVLDSDVHIKLWESEPPQFVDEAACTVRARVGELVDGADLWWQLNDDQVTDNVYIAIKNYMLPFAQRMHSRQCMARWLTDAEVVKKKYPLPIINLAILQFLLGNPSEGCSLLGELQRNAIGAWRTRAVEVAGRLGCTEGLGPEWS